MSAFLVVHFISLNHNTRHDLVVNETFLLVIDVLSLAFVWPSQLRGHSRSRIYPGIITAWPVILCWQGFSSTVHSQASEGSKIALLGSFPRPNVKITCASDMSKNWLPVSSNMLHWCSRYCLALCLICFFSVCSVLFCYITLLMPLDFVFQNGRNGSTGSAASAVFQPCHLEYTVFLSLPSSNTVPVQNHS